MTDLSDRPAGAEPPERPQDVTTGRASARAGPQPGDPAPDVALRDAAGDEGRLSALWTRAPRGLALIFLRHFG